MRDGSDDSVNGKKMPRSGRLIWVSYYATIAYFIAAVAMLFVFVLANNPQRYERVLELVLIPLWIGAMTFWISCLRFWYRHDRYSRSGVWLIFLNVLYALYYFKSVIVRRDRKLVNEINPEPVLGNKIHIETEED